MKLPLLLAQYLREHHHLRLPGVGSFYFSGPAAPATDAATPPVPSTIRFEYGHIKAPDDSLIDFIKEKTGKIKPLAMADLSSYIESGLEMLNIGKPFYIDGIGTIQKTKEGQLDFIAREITVIKQEETVSKKEEQADKRKSIFDDEKYEPSVNPWQKIVVAVLILGGLAVVVLGGYYLYTKKNGEANLQGPRNSLNDTTNQSQKDTLNIQADSTNSLITYASNSGSYKFILETTKNKKRALKRYEQLKYSNLKMEAIDSSAYKLYFVIPASANDTSRIKDSLSRYYASKVRIEQ